MGIEKMLKIDISKAIPQGFGAYLLGIIPGLFFQASIAIGQPHLAASVISRAREIYPFGPYALLVIFLASALLIGQGFFLLAWTSELVIALAVTFWRYALRVTLASEWLYRRFAKLQGVPPKQNFFIRSLNRAIFWARGLKMFPHRVRPVLKCLHAATKQLLKTRYGLDSEDLGHSRWDADVWEVWHSVLGKPLSDFREASISAKTFLGTGFAGFAALYLAPDLRRGYFFTLCLTFSFAGLFTLMNLAAWRFGAVKWSIRRLRSVLAELSDAVKLAEKAESDEEPTKAISATIGES
jgi:hypothetical protein